MSTVAKSLSALVLVVLLIAGVFLLPAVQTWLVVINLPDFPDWPEPSEVLSETDDGMIYFSTHSPFDLQVILSGNRGVETTGLGYLTFPSSQSGSKLPAMVILPGSGGIKPGREHEYAEFLNAEGIAAFVVDYYAARGLNDDVAYLIRTGSVTEFDLITDAYEALGILSTHPRIDGERIGVVGFSYGGMAARLAMDDRIREALAPAHPGFAAHIDIYGPCFQKLGTQRTNGAPLLSLRGTKDASNNLQDCADRERELGDIGVDVSAVIYEGAGHAWENDQPLFFSEESPYIDGCTWHYDARGNPMVDGELLADNEGASRAARIATRLRLGVRLADCVHYGYLIGRDEQTRDLAYRDAADFLKNNL